MTNGRWTLLTAVLLVIVAGQWGGQPQPVTAAGTASQSQGRFQFALGANQIYVIDTLTSEIWTKPPLEGHRWQSLGAPVRAEQDPAEKGL